MGIFSKKPKSIESAILGGDLRQVKKRLSGGLDVNAPRDSRGSRLIHYAVNSTPEVLLLLIKHGADVNVRTSDGMAPIHTAAATANYESVRLLVENGADVNLEDNEGRNALKHVFNALPIDKVYASWGLPMDSSEQQERQKIARFLFEHGANTSKDSPDADEVARVTGTSEMEVMRGFMLKLLSEGKNPFEPLSREQRRQMAEQFPDVAERVRKQFGIQW
jgi:hypothetical protein